MTDRDRFHLHILPGMPATREGAMFGGRVRVVVGPRRFAVVGDPNRVCTVRHEWTTDAIGGECDPAEVISGLR